jgi:hypothetical protein
MTETTVPLQNLPKHDRYRNAYKRFGFYWGLGVEHETYLMTARTKTVKTFVGAMRPERYCVSYYVAYKNDVLKAALVDMVAKGPLTVPILMNCHSLTKCDVNGEHETTYERVPKPTPKFAGKTLFEWMCEQSDWFRTEIGKIFMWDGDTIEFMTQRFYRATVDAVIEELQEGEERFVQELAKLPKKGVVATYGPLRLASPRNEPFTTFVTNPYHVSMFNNGTIHINVTLPTRLGWNKMPLWHSDFVEKHRRLARLVQWLEPLWIAVHGSGDPLTSSNQKGFAAGSQRLAVSRYIGVGTFNTDVMPVGKILQIYRDPKLYPWYKTDTAYDTLEVIGLDINFNKHGAHGLELRFLDQLPMESLRSVIEQVVVLMDLALEGFAVPDPLKDPSWIAAASAAIYRGAQWEVAPIEINTICAALRIGEHQKAPMSPAVALTWLFAQLESRRAFCWDNMVGTVNIRNRCL